MVFPTFIGKRVVTCDLIFTSLRATAVGGTVFSFVKDWQQGGLQAGKRTFINSSFTVTNRLNIFILLLAYKYDVFAKCGKNMQIKLIKQRDI